MFPQPRFCNCSGAALLGENIAVLCCDKDEVAFAKMFPYDERLPADQLKPWVPPALSPDGASQEDSHTSLRQFGGRLPGAPEIEIKGDRDCLSK